MSVQTIAALVYIAVGLALAFNIWCKADEVGKEFTGTMFVMCLLFWPLVLLSTLWDKFFS